jgi:hypothetical protein
MDDSDSYEVTAAAGKQVASIRVYKDEEDREVLISFTDGTELAISMEVRSVTSATLYKTTGYVPDTLVRYDEAPSEAGPFRAVIRASTKRLE